MTVSRGFMGVVTLIGIVMSIGLLPPCQAQAPAPAPAPAPASDGTSIDQGIGYLLMALALALAYLIHTMDATTSSYS
ncbi:uncharacterized protein [Coffea arabica]|uniref:Uncharacterized protein n=1 Tax=Coffea arabica TaxID=13443 RepID=A0A6P6WL99_COFAR|nr:arabinogalactan protein 41-like [Coffea arabica]